MPWSNNAESGEGQVITAGVLLSGTPVVGEAMDVAVLDFVSFFFDLTRVAATSVEWWFEATINGTDWFRLPVNEDTSVPPNVTFDNGEYTWTWAIGKATWAHPNLRVTGIKKIRPVVDSTAGTTDTVDVSAYGEAYSAK